MTIKAKSHSCSHFFGWLFLLIALVFWVIHFMADGGQVAESMWWPSLIVGSIRSILFGMILLKGLFD